MILENKVQFKRFLFWSLLVLFFFLILGNLFFFYQYKTYNKNYNNKLTLIVEMLEEKYPDITKNEIIALLNQDTIATNSDIFSKYGIDIKTDSLLLENDKVFSFFAIIYNLILLVLSLTFLFLYLKHEKKYESEIKKIVKLIEEINKSNYSLAIDENSEDELSILKNEIYKTTIMLREAAENESLDKLKLKDSLSDISHQLKTPLTSINIMLDNILDDPDMNNTTKTKFLQNIKREITNISSLVEEILKLSKFDANVIKFEKRNVFLREIVKKAITNVEMLAELKNVKINIITVVDDTLSCDLKWQVEAITNILKNCIEHSKKNSKIDVYINSNKIYKSIVIKDNGEGIDKHDLPHIFERFYKGKNSSKDSVGIGLALSKTIIEKDKGSIIVDSQKDATTIFTIKYYS